jgi:hypothetical protein
MSANSRHYRSKAAESARQAVECKLPADVELFRQAEHSWSTLAENEEWLESNGDKVMWPKGEAATCGGISPSTAD